MRLFFYGVLMGHVASPAIAGMLAGLGAGRRASITGRLMAVTDPRGAYPVLLPGQDQVWGMVHEAGSVDLPRLNAFEGNEYRRASVNAQCEDGTVLEAQAYLYQVRVRPGFVAIPHGDFARWIEETGTAPLAG
jgi:gamma-glutamylcyclotransferase (GGCT)/AIG2-like uncharacterized protein YtfP